MSNIQVIIHCLPREIDSLDRILDDLKRSSHFLEEQDNIVLDVSLNTSSLFTNWGKSKLDKDFFINKFNIIEKKADWTFRNQFLVEDNEKCLGINDKRRNSIRSAKEDITHFMYLDLDVFFSSLNLKYLFDSLDSIKNKYSIISPELVKLWDPSWDILTNKNYLKHEYGYFKELDPYSIEQISLNNVFSDEVNLKQIPYIKFGGGWFNTFSSNLLKLIDIPDSLGPYGLDDTFIMQGANIMKSKGYDVSQYVLQGMVVCENIKYSLYDLNPYKDYIHDNSFNNKGRNFKQKYRENSNKNFNTEINKLNNKL